MAMGNHDNRQTFWQSVGRDELHLVDRHVSIVESPLMDWYLLDSLEGTNYVPGSLGDSQLQWLSAKLDAKADKPAIVMVHHQPDDRPVIAGLEGHPPAARRALPARRQVKALIFGHTPAGIRPNADGLHHIICPPPRDIFRENQPTGWVDVRSARRRGQSN